MIRIQSFETKGKLRNIESLAFGRGIEAEIKVLNPEVLKVADVFEVYQTALQNYDDSIVGLVKSKLTNQISEADAQHDNLFAGINEQIQTATRHFDENKKAAATRLKLIADAYAERPKRGAVNQIKFTNNFIQELIADAYKADIETLDLIEWVIRLKMVNDRCAELNRLRAEELSERRSKGSAVEIRNIYEHAYDNLVECLNAQIQRNGDEPYVKLFSWWNAYIDHYK